MRVSLLVSRRTSNTSTPTSTLVFLVVVMVAAVIPLFNGGSFASAKNVSAPRALANSSSSEGQEEDMVKNTIIRRVLKKKNKKNKKHSNKAPKASKGAASSGGKGKGSATLSPSFVPSSQPTDDLCADLTTTKDVLLALRDGFTNADVTLNWDNATNPCDGWTGVNCVEGEVARINLGKNVIEGKIWPLGLRGCVTPLVSSLTALIFHGNFLTGSIPSDIGMFTSLTSLNFVYTELSGSMPSEVCALRDISLSELKGVCSESFTCTCCTNACDE